MKKIEDNIRKIRGQFDDAEPPEGHFIRFAQKLEKAENRRKGTKLLQFSFIWRAAAAVLVLLTASVIYNQIDNLNLIKSGHSSELPAELINATNYYAHLNQEKIIRIAELTDNEPENNEILNMVQQEAEALDQNSQDLKEKYIETKDDRVIDAIITNYRVLSELLDHIIQRVSETQ